MILLMRLPTGTVTFLFSDVEGSTRLLQEHGEAYAELLAEHRRALREAFARHNGVEVDTQGDAFFVAFARASDALAAASSAQAAVADGPVRVRMGVHTGEPLVTEEGYVGMDVHRAARIAAAGHGGQVLVSQATRDVAGVDSLRDLGDHRLKDLAAPERIYQLGGVAFPPLKTLYRTNLPVVGTPLVGRERELEEAGMLVRSHRMLTLTGPGGSGKTRLAIHVAANAAEDFPDGVFWIPLQAIRDPAVVERTIAAAVGADDGLISYVGGKKMLVLLDNFEQVIDAATAVSALVEGTPSAKVLVTSREPLHIGCEHRYAVEPLRPDEAETLFAERARAVVARFHATPEIAAICERLDRLPLAIELAAARTALLDPATLLARLDQRLPLLASRARDAPARQRTLRATIEWSYELLEPEEQSLFAGLAVFGGSFSLDAAEAICDADVDALEALVVKNLVRRRWETGRLLLLDTIREYASDRLAQSPEADEIHRRHAEFFLAFARAANLNAGDFAPGGQRLYLAFEEQDNFRAALAWALSSGEIQLGLELATALEQFWVSNDASEGVRWFRALFEHDGAGTVSPAVRAHALRALGGSTHIAGDPAAAGRFWEESLALFDELDDDHGRAVLLHRLSIVAMLGGDHERARELVLGSYDLHARNDDWWRRTWGHAQTTGTRGAIARDSGDEDLARELLRESAELADAAGVAWWHAGMFAELGALSLRVRCIDAADGYARDSLVIAERLHDRPGQVFGVGLLACVAAARGELRRAGRLWGAIENRTAHAPLGGWERHRDECAARMRDVVGAEFEIGLAVGRDLELDEAVEEALGGAHEDARPR
jgi:predicted ATPase